MQASSCCLIMDIDNTYMKTWQNQSIRVIGGLMSCVRMKAMTSMIARTGIRIIRSGCVWSVKKLTKLPRYCFVHTSSQPHPAVHPRTSPFDPVYCLATTVHVPYGTEYRFDLFIIKLHKLLQTGILKKSKIYAQNAQFASSVRFLAWNIIKSELFKGIFGIIRTLLDICTCIQGIMLKVHSPWARGSNGGAGVTLPRPLLHCHCHCHVPR